MSQRTSQNLYSKFSTIKNGKINFAFDPAEKPDTLKPLNHPQKGGKWWYSIIIIAKNVEFIDLIRHCDII